MLTLDLRAGVVGFDTNHICSDLDSDWLVRQGAGGFGCRYLSAPIPATVGKRLTGPEWRVAESLKIPIFGNFEWYTRADSPRNIGSWEIPGQGRIDARWAFEFLDSIDYPVGWPVPFSVDDAPRNGTDLARAATYWLDEVYPTAIAIPRWRWWVGAYGGGQHHRYMNLMFPDRWATWFKWQASAWSFREYPQGPFVVEDGVHIFQELQQLQHPNGWKVDINRVTRRITPWGNGSTYQGDTDMLIQTPDAAIFEPHTMSHLDAAEYARAGSPPFIKVSYEAADQRRRELLGANVTQQPVNIDTNALALALAAKLPVTTADGRKVVLEVRVVQ